MQIKTTMKYHFTSVRTAIIKKKNNTKCWQGHGEKKTLVHYWRKCKLVQPLWKTVEVPQKTELVTYDSGIYLKENENTNWKRYFHPLCLTAASFTIAKTWKQPKCLSRNEWWRKHIYTHTMEYHKKEGNSAIYDNKDGPWRQYAKWNKSDRARRNCMISLTCRIFKKKKKERNKEELRYQE